ncbi:alpha-N-acetylgalactosaminide alpha-2,6-sialyltransferase 2 isoform X1 [Sander lucioperca]|uniref:alpha-N-acetylgalactosaminide alpha-2,6-sialyltransferase n=1 Tax=Sander lucioperca TaxID=283035 RepID=A0A8C9ZLS7_SANLU|nr:alpha-N-acetylgalactosaminide alpha-2,6-sialyltransferase 2 isoform X1 [Sander lucioperca]XP_035853541.1 alpha-N-acetylgalactosaminide alpha-2,6-sialyltransferase 2 isoform X1 [Sander lucioperca]
MALRRKLALSVLTVSSLLFFYILCMYLENHLSIEPLKHCHGSTQRPSSSSQNSTEPLDRQSNSDQSSHLPPTSILPPELFSGTVLHEHPQTPTPKTQTVTAAKHKPAENNSLDKVKTTEPPYIGDTYMSEDIRPQTNCPDGIRSRVTKTEWSGRFRRDVPVLQWSKHVTHEQHKRLSHYPGAHGWGGIEYKTLEETLSVLNSSANWQLLDDWKDRRNESECIRCAVVGNGGILKDSKKGKEIDSHHYVFRSNGAIIKGFEQDVGSRTTHYTFSTNTLMNSMRSYARAGFKGPPWSKETRYVFLPDHGRDYLLMKAAVTHTPVNQGPEKGKDPSMYFGQDVSAEKLKMYHPDFIRYLRNRFLRSKALKTKYKDIYRPSTGAVMLLAALHTCDQVSAYGFMTPDYKNYSDHYYDKTYHGVGFFINHDLRMEMTLWQQLHQEGLIRLYMHKDFGSNQK